MRCALTEIKGAKQFVTRKQALKEGTCFFCGAKLSDHPKGKRGRIPVNRHHRVKLLFHEVYEEVTQSPFPQDETNVFWVGLGCHIAFHDVRDPFSHNPVAIEHEIFEQFLEAMAQCNFGYRFLKQPASLPGYLCPNQRPKRAAFILISLEAARTSLNQDSRQWVLLT